MKKNNLGLITFIYFIVLLLTICAYDEFKNIFTIILNVLVVVSWFIHILILSIKIGLRQREEDKKRSYVEEKELQEKYDYYKSKER